MYNQSHTHIHTTCNNQSCTHVHTTCMHNQSCTHVHTICMHNQSHTITHIYTTCMHNQSHTCTHHMHAQSSHTHTHIYTTCMHNQSHTHTRTHHMHAQSSYTRTLYTSHACPISCTQAYTPHACPISRTHTSLSSHACTYDLSLSRLALSLVMFLISDVTAIGSLWFSGLAPHVQRWHSRFVVEQSSLSLCLTTHSNALIQVSLLHPLYLN